jgi:hypothetical protein
MHLLDAEAGATLFEKNNCPNHEMEEWLILHFFYHVLNPMSKPMFDTAARGTFMGKEIEIAKNLLNDMQDNHSQWHIERSSTRRWTPSPKEKNEDPTTNVDELTWYH